MAIAQQTPCLSLHTLSTLLYVYIDTKTVDAQNPESVQIQKITCTMPAHSPTDALADSSTDAILKLAGLRDNQML